MDQTITVLLVDDNDILIDTLKDGLEDVGYVVRFAHDGVEALEAFDEYHPDAVVIDIKMPNIDGHQLLRALRGDPATAGVPLIIITALPHREDKVASFYSGADAFMLKPVTSREVAEAVTYALTITPQERVARMQRYSETEEDAHEA